MDCGYSCHDKCQEHVPKNCTKYKAVSDPSNPNQTLTRNGGDNGSVNSSKLLVSNFLLSALIPTFSYMLKNVYYKKCNVSVV